MRAENLAPKSIKDYQDKVGAFMKWVADALREAAQKAAEQAADDGRDACDPTTQLPPVLVANFTLAHAQAYIAGRLHGGSGRGPLAPSSAAGHVRVLKAISTRLFLSGDTGESRMANLKQPTVRPTEVRPKNVRPNVFVKLLEAVSSLPRTAIRNMTLIAILFDTGPRVSELVSLNRADVFLDEGYIVLRSPAKGGPVRHLPLGRETKRILRRHLGRTKGSGPLFMGERGRPMTTKAVQLVLMRLSIKARVPRAFPHAFRHEASAWYTTRGAPVSAKCAVFGWKPTPSDMEAGYTILTPEQIVAMHQIYSPLDHFMKVADTNRRAA